MENFINKNGSFNHGKWLREARAGSINEAPMDKDFMEEWERNCKALLNHLKHESKNRKYDRTQSAEIYDFIGIIEDAINVPAEMAEIVGMQENRSDISSTYESKLNEGFSTWIVKFDDSTVSGIEYDPSKSFNVKARNTIEAIKKAVKQAGGSGKDWMAVDVKSLNKK